MAAQRHGDRRQRGVRQARRGAGRCCLRAPPPSGTAPSPPRSGTGCAAPATGTPGAGRRAGRRAPSSTTSTSWFPAFLAAGAGVELPKGRRSTRSRRRLAGPGRRRAGPARGPGDAAGCSRTRTSARCRSTRRSTASTRPTSSCTPGTSPAPPARTSGSTPTFCAQMLAGMEPMAEVLCSSGQYGPRGRRCPPTPTPRPGCSASSAATRTGALTVRTSSDEFRRLRLTVTSRSAPASPR